MQRPQRSVSGARTNYVDTDERQEMINEGGTGGCLVSCWASVPTVSPHRQSPPSVPTVEDGQ
jgi:hypothetical protein